MSAQRPTGPEGQRPVPGDRVPSAGRGGTAPAAGGELPAPLGPLDATPRVSPRCTWQVVEGEAVLLDLQGKRLLGLNRAGSFVLPLLDGQWTVAGLAIAMVDRFGIEPARAENDLRLFLTELVRRGFVEGIDR